MPAVGTARERFPIKFYLVCMIFILLDVDAAFLYPWALIFRELGVFGFVEMLVFVALLGGGFVYAWKIGRPRLVDRWSSRPRTRPSSTRSCARYPVKRSALLPALHLLQEQEGWLHHATRIEYAATLLDLTPAQVHDTATYYTMYRFKPVREDAHRGLHEPLLRAGRRRRS